MSRFADPEATERMSLGSCQCPGKPHEEDWLEMRTELGTQDAIRLAAGDSLGVLSILIKDWNLQDVDGEVPPIDEEHLGLLFSDTFEALDAWIEGHVRMRTSLPKASAAPSRSSSRANGSRTPRAQKAR